jgi:hypothetical protein
MDDAALGILVILIFLSFGLLAATILALIEIIEELLK